MEEADPQAELLYNKLVAIQHPNIVRTYAGRRDENRCCKQLLQSWVGGRSLAKEYLCEQGGHQAENHEVAQLAVALANAIHYLHSQDMLHCDITPFNVLLSDNGTPVLADFGIATLLNEPGKPKGYSSCYSPPELHPPYGNNGISASGWTLGSHTDRYMLGSTLFTVACGCDGRSEHPVTKTKVLTSAVERLQYDQGSGGIPQTPLRALRPDLDPKLANFIEKLISLTPESRYGSDNEMLAAVKSATNHLAEYRLARRFSLCGTNWHRKRSVKVAFAIILGLLLLHPYTAFRSPVNLPVFALSDVASALRMPGTALAIIDEAPVQSAETDYAKGKALERMDKLDVAMNAYKSSLQRDPGYEPAVTAVSKARSALGKASLDLGLYLYRKGEHLREHEQLLRAVHCGICSVEGYTALAQVAEKRGHIKEAAKHWDRISKLKPGAVEPHFKASLLFLDIGDLEKAYHHAAKARDIHLRPKPVDDVSSEKMREMLDEVTSVCLQESRLSNAQARSTRMIYDKVMWVTRAKNLQPSDVVYNRLGRYFERLGDLSTRDRKAGFYEKAIKNLQQAKQLKPCSVPINTDLARCIDKLKRVF